MKVRSAALCGLLALALVQSTVAMAGMRDTVIPFTAPPPTEAPPNECRITGVRLVYNSFHGGVTTQRVDPVQLLKNLDPPLPEGMEPPYTPRDVYKTICLDQYDATPEQRAANPRESFTPHPMFNFKIEMSDPVKCGLSSDLFFDPFNSKNVFVQENHQLCDNVSPGPYGAFGSAARGPDAKKVPLGDREAGLLAFALSPGYWRLTVTPVKADTGVVHLQGRDTTCQDNTPKGAPVTIHVNVYQNCKYRRTQKKCDIESAHLVYSERVLQEQTANGAASSYIKQRVDLRFPLDLSGESIRTICLDRFNLQPRFNVRFTMKQPQECGGVLTRRLYDPMNSHNPDVQAKAMTCDTVQSGDANGVTPYYSAFGRLRDGSMTNFGMGPGYYRLEVTPLPRAASSDSVDHTCDPRRIEAEKHLDIEWEKSKMVRLMVIADCQALGKSIEEASIISPERVIVVEEEAALGADEEGYIAERENKISVRPSTTTRAAKAKRPKPRQLAAMQDAMLPLDDHTVRDEAGALWLICAAGAAVAAVALLFAVALWLWVKAQQTQDDGKSTLLSTLDRSRVGTVQLHSIALPPLCRETEGGDVAECSPHGLTVLVNGSPVSNRNRKRERE